MAAFTQVLLPVAAEFAPELVLVSAGFDAGLDEGLLPLFLPHSRLYGEYP
jgi:acetoin utilization deacetylase AcuC-like enzyme